MPLGRKVDGGSNYKCSNFEDRERRLERITMNITLGHAGHVPNENRKISMISLGQVEYLENCFDFAREMNGDTGTTYRYR